MNVCVPSAEIFALFLYDAPSSVAPRRFESLNVIYALHEYHAPLVTPENIGAVASIVNVADALFPAKSVITNVCAPSVLIGAALRYGAPSSVAPETVESEKKIL